MKPISRIDDSKNLLFYRGFDATELSRNHSFEEVFYILLNGEPPSNAELKEIFQKLIDLRKYYTTDLTSLADLARNLGQLKDHDQLTCHDTLLTFVSLAPLIIANKFGKYHNRKIERPNNRLGHVANFLWMIQERIPSDTDVKDVETLLILHMDDPSNPSLSALHSFVKDGKSISEALLAALAVHIEPMHHGAGTEAMVMFEEIKQTINLEDYLKKRLDSGKKIFGLGHRVYRGTDPRAIVLREILERRTRNSANEWLLEVIDRVKRRIQCLKESQEY